MDKGREEVANGKVYVKEVQSEIKILEQEMLTMVTNTEELASANQKQYEISNTIKKNIESIDSVTESNVTNVYEINNAVEDLDKTVESVNRMIHQFKLESENKLLC